MRNDISGKALCSAPHLTARFCWVHPLFACLELEGASAGLGRRWGAVFRLYLTPPKSGRDTIGLYCTYF